MKQYVNPVELTAELLNTLIEKITVHEAVKGEDGSLSLIHILAKGSETVPRSDK